MAFESRHQPVARLCCTLIRSSRVTHNKALADPFSHDYCPIHTYSCI